MGLRMDDLLDAEKYLLLESVYFQPRGEMRFAFSRAEPMPLGRFLALTDSCDCAFRLTLGGRESRRRYLRERKNALLKRYERSPNLKDVVITSFLNDNYGPLGNAPDGPHTGFVGMALRDGSGNGAVVYSGCELNYLSNIVLDWGGCVAAGLGVRLRQHDLALSYFDRELDDIPGEKSILGHSKGGNLATYVFVSRPEPRVNAYLVNAQPLNWFMMNEAQRATLKSERFEYIVHADDPLVAVSYVPYVSRVAPINRYAPPHDIASIHGFAEADFDALGNLRGNRIIRETGDRLAAYLYKDTAREKVPDRDELTDWFQKKMDAVSNLPRLFGIALESMLPALGAEAALLWMRDADENGPFVYPLLSRGGDFSGALFRLKLRPGQSVAAQCVFEGLPLITRDARAHSHGPGLIERASGFPVNNLITVPLDLNEQETVGALQILNKPAPFDAEDLLTASVMAQLMLKTFLARGGYLPEKRDFDLIRLSGGSSDGFSLAQCGLGIVSFRFDVEKERFLSDIRGETLDGGAEIYFGDRVFTRASRAAMGRAVKKDFVFLRWSDRPDAAAALAREIAGLAARRPLLAVADLFDCPEPEEAIRALRALAEQKYISAIVLLRRDADHAARNEIAGGQVGVQAQKPPLAQSEILRDA